VLFRSTSDTIVAGMMLSLVYVKAIQWLTPFKDPALNRIKETSLWQIFFVFFIALLIKMNDVDSDFLLVCLLLVFFVNFLILVGQYLLQWCGRRVCVSHTAAGQELEKDVGSVEMQNHDVTSVVVSPDTSVVSAVREGGAKEDGTTAAGGTAGHVCVSAAGSDMMHTASGGHTPTHSPFHPTEHEENAL
jgi:hypothetical protein